MADPGFLKGGCGTVLRAKFEKPRPLWEKPRPFSIVFEINYQPYQSNRSVSIRFERGGGVFGGVEGACFV